MRIMHEDGICLFYHLDVMRKNVKKNFMETFGLFEGSKLYKTYKSINKKVEKAILNAGEDVEYGEMIDVALSADESSMLKEFLESHISNIKKEQGEQGGTLSRIDDHPVLIPLQTVLYTLKIKKHENEQVNV